MNSGYSILPKRDKARGLWKKTGACLKPICQKLVFIKAGLYTSE